MRTLDRAPAMPYNHYVSSEILLPQVGTLYISAKG